MKRFEIETEATKDNLSKIANFIDSSLSHLEVNPEVKGRLCVAIDEAVTNVILYAYPNGGGTIRVVLTREAQTLTIEMIDQGVAFDPTHHPTPDTTIPLEQRPIGGLGIHLMRNMTNQLRYAREGNSNHLWLTKELGGSDV